MSTGAALVYEVTLEVDTAIAGDYRRWLDAHVHQMLAFPGFIDARVFAVEEPRDSDCVGWCVHYGLRDEHALETYLREHAPGMRADGIARFGESVRASRRILRPA